MLVHLDHAAVGVAGAQIAAQQLILLFGRPGLAGGDLEVAIAADDAALGGARLEIAGDDADRDAGGAIEAGRAIGDVLAAPEADPAERVVESPACGPVSSVKTFRSVLPAR